MILISLFLINTFLENRKFDPEIDIIVKCDLINLNGTGSSVFHDNMEYVFMHSTGDIEYREMKTPWRSDATIKLWRDYYGKLCILEFNGEKQGVEWHKKTFCELCLDEWTQECGERCACDELETPILDAAEAMGGSILISCNLTDELTGDYQKLINRIDDNEEAKCIKAHEMDECEKNNPEWVWDYEWEEIGLFAVKKAVCRKKTVADLNCSELMDYFENGPQCHKFIPPLFVWDCKYPKPHTNKRSILYLMIKKGCGVET